MDHPIFIPDIKRFFRKKAGTLCQRIGDALQFDMKDEFLRLIRDPEFKQVCLEINLLQLIYRWDALEIGIAVFNGETKIIIDPEDDVLFQGIGITPLHSVASMSSPKLTKYFLERGYNVDALCDFQSMNMKQATPLDLALQSINTGFDRGYTADMRGPWSTRKSILELLVFHCRNNRTCLETVRLLVQNTSNKEHVKQAFIDYANNGQLVQFSALFMAVPDLFLSYNVSLRGALPSIGILYLELNSLEKRTDIEEALLLLLDVFTIIGDKLVAFTRLEDNDIVCCSTSSELPEHFEENVIAGLLDEVAHRKQGVSSPDDYYLRFFKPVRPEADQLAKNHSRDCLFMGNYDSILDGEPILSFWLKRKDITIDYINSEFRNKSPKHDEALLYKAMDNKLSSMSTFHLLFESIGEILMKEEKHQPQWSMKEEKHLPQWSMKEEKHQLQQFPLFSSITFKPKEQSFPLGATRAKPCINHKFTPSFEKKAMQQMKLTSFVPFAKLSHFPMIV